jgi:hypothetical protein
LSSTTEVVQSSVLRFAPDGNTLAAQEVGSTVYLWDVKKKKLTAILKHPDEVSLRLALAFSPDSRTLAVVDHKGAIHLWEIASQSERAILGGKQKNIAPLAFSPDGRTLAAGCCQDGRYSAKLWDLLSIKRKPPDAEEIGHFWTHLRGKDAKVAYIAIRTLTAFPAQALPLLRKQLLPLLVEEEEARKLSSWVADLDSNDFASREKAHKNLEDAGLRAEAALQQALSNKPSLEVRRRGLKLLEAIDRQKKIEPIQQLRALEVLEHIGTAEARALLADLAKGVPEARLTQEAKASLLRLARRPTPKPQAGDAK